MKHPQPHFLSSLTPSVCRKRLESVSPPSSSAAAAAMSHNYPYRRPQPDSGLRSDPGSYVSSGRRHSSPDRQIYQAPQESYSYPSSSSRVAQWSRDGAVNILSSCGLEPDDLALLAEIPEDRLTVETLPQVLQQIKGKRGTVRQYAHNAPSSSSSSSSYPPSSTRRPIVKPTTSDWDRPPSQMLQYQVDQVKSSPPLPELDRWGNPITFSSVRAEQTPSSSSSTSSSYVVDFHHRPAPPDYGKNCRDTGPVSSQDYSNKSKSLEFIKPGREGRQVTSQDYHHRPAPLQFGRSDRDASPASSQDYYNRLRPPDFGKAGRDVQVFPQERPSFSSVGRDRTSRPFSQPGPADYRPPPLLEDSHLKPLWGGSGSETLPTKSSSQPSDVMPSKQNAMDFHGTTPSMYPHSCSLCAITVMSEKVWLKHINGPHHADGQLSLLQKFPNWDCRLETVGRVDNQPERWKDDRKPGEKPQTSNRNSNSSQQHKKKVSEKSKVVCVKFPAHSVDEKYLKKLAEPFGRIVKILIFPSLAFVELGSMDQAKDMVKFHGNYPPTVNRQQMEFTISHTFNFLQSDFPVDLDSCITLDELEEDECDYLDEEVRHESESPASRVLYLKNVPLDFFSDVEFIRLVRGYGTAVHFFRIPGRHSGFIEMSSSSEAQRAIKGLKDKPVRVNGSRIYAMISSNYTRLSKGWTVGSLLDSEEENKSRSQGSRRSERLKKPADRDEPSRKSEGRKQSSKKTPEKESSSRKSEEKESRTTRKRSSEKESASKQNPEKVSRTSPENEPKEKESASKHSAKESHDNKSEENESASKHSAKESHDKKSEENESASKTDKKRVDKKSSSETDRSEKNYPEKTSEKSSRRTPERESSSRKSDEKESKTSKRKSSEKESKPRKSLEESSDKPTDEKSSERESKIEESGSERSSKRTPETESKEKKSTDSDSIQTPEKDSGSEMSQNKTIKRKGDRENDSVPEKKGKKNESEGESEELEIQETPEPGLKESGSPHPPGSTGNPAKLKCEQKPDADGLKDSEVNMESQSEPTGGAVELQKPTKPVGSEFVRPVVGYFCNLCQLIYADEDEAKQQHCSSLEHYRKYQEKTGKDPWAS
uniref:Ankyrin repeat domain-containing protein 12-like n=1 Tax=Labrus bergylta TaxID=56723 RepID=A0A3Q3FXA8_9LABR